MVESKNYYTMDSEGNGLWRGKPDDCTKNWCVGFLDHHTGEYIKFDINDDFEGLKAFFWKARRLVCHNIWGYDAPCLHTLLGCDVHPECMVVDTLVWSRSLYPDRVFEGGHGLDAWGERNGIPKPPIEDWSRYTPEIVNRLEQDVRNNHETYKKLVIEAKMYDSKRMLRTEDKVAQIIAKQTYRGIEFDRRLAYWLLGKLQTRLLELDGVIRPLLKTKVIKDGVIMKSFFTQKGGYAVATEKCFGDLLDDVNFQVQQEGDKSEGVFQRVKWEEVNIGSDKQMMEQILPYGWEPVEFTDKGNPKITEVSLERIPALAHIAKPFKARRQCASRLSDVMRWLKNVDPDGRIRGKVNPQGAVTLRMTHGIVVNVPKYDEDEPYSEFYRMCFTTKKDESLPDWTYTKDDPRTGIKTVILVKGQYAQVGCDASGLENRMLANRMNDPELTEIICTGDFHTKVWETIDGYIHSRKKTKTVEYGLFYGAGDPKLGALADHLDEITGDIAREEGWQHMTKGKFAGNWKQGNRGKSVPWHVVGLAINGQRIRDGIMEGLPSLGALTKRVQETSKRGYIVGMDGRRLIMRRGYDHNVQTHKALNVLLQGDGALVMKVAQIFLDHWITTEELRAWFVNTVHDEMQLEVHPDDRFRVAELARLSIIKAGEHLKMKCPLDAESKIGVNWGETH